ncbi:MAG: SIS domain-containing protein, partial [Candidatus Aenigmarchaeota archaeon]|nr:SIS domain-containing protein [Candidatus Aenigmarchaeota archaeon]
CGTAYHAALTASYIFSHIAKKHVNVVLASEFHNYKDFLIPETLVVAVSQSGETADVIDAIKTAKSKGTKTLAILNVMGSSMMRLCDDSLLIHAGPEIAVASTKAFTGQIAVLSLLAYACAGKAEEGKKYLASLSHFIKSDILAEHSVERIKKLAHAIRDAKDAFLIGRGLSYPLALEGALKIKEVSYIHAEGFAGGELKHGTIALIEEGTPCIVLVDNENKDMMISNAHEVKARGGLIIGIAEKEDAIFDVFFKIPAASPILFAVIMQLLAYYLALERECSIDCPKNLAKVVTVR